MKNVNGELAFVLGVILIVIAGGGLIGVNGLHNYPFNDFNDTEGGSYIGMEVSISVVGIVGIILVVKSKY